MKRISVLVFLALIFFGAAAQVPHFTKYEINKTGRYAYFPADPGEFSFDKSPDSSDVYTAEVEFDSVYYGLIMVVFPNNSFNGSTKEDMQSVLTSYLDFLQLQFNISETTSFGTGHTLESNPDAVGVIDYWSDATGYEYSIKGWVDTKTLAVLYIGGEMENENVRQIFLNGFRFN